MAKQSIQGFVELASGLGELTKSRALDAANELVALIGPEGPRAKLNKQAAALADDLMSAAEANRRQLVAIVHKEVEAALGRVDVDRLVADVNGMSAAVSALAGQLEEIATMVASRARGGGSDIALPHVDRPAVPSLVMAAKKAPAKKATAKKAPGEEGDREEGDREEGAREEGAREEGDREEGAREEGAAKKAPAKKAPAKKAPAKKAPAKKAPAKKAPAKKAPAKRAPAKKSAGG